VATHRVQEEKKKRKTEEFEGLFENYITAVTTDYDSDVK
jgi:hypothetical protein